MAVGVIAVAGAVVVAEAAAAAVGVAAGVGIAPAEVPAVAAIAAAAQWDDLWWVAAVAKVKTALLAIPSKHSGVELLEQTPEH